jgi:hypothetical protein
MESVPYSKDDIPVLILYSAFRQNLFTMSMAEHFQITQDNVELMQRQGKLEYGKLQNLPDVDFWRVAKMPSHDVLEQLVEEEKESIKVQALDIILDEWTRCGALYDYTPEKGQRVYDALLPLYNLYIFKRKKQTVQYFVRLCHTTGMNTCLFYCDRDILRMLIIKTAEVYDEIPEEVHILLDEIKKQSKKPKILV